MAIPTPQLKWKKEEAMEKEKEEREEKGEGLVQLQCVYICKCQSVVG